MIRPDVVYSAVYGRTATRSGIQCILGSVHSVGAYVYACVCVRKNGCTPQSVQCVYTIASFAFGRRSIFSSSILSFIVFEVAFFFSFFCCCCCCSVHIHSNSLSSFVYFFILHSLVHLSAVQTKPKRKRRRNRYVCGAMRLRLIFVFIFSLFFFLCTTRQLKNEYSFIFFSPSMAGVKTLFAVYYTKFFVIQN